MNKNIYSKIIYFLSMFFFIFITFFSLSKNTFHYVPDSIFLIILTSFLFFYFKKIGLNNSSFIFLNILMILHELGALGAFNYSYLGMNYDVILHFSSGLIISLVLYHIFRTKIFAKSPYKKAVPVIIFLMVLGISVICELIEFGGVLFMIDGQGFFGVEAGVGFIRNLSVDYWDTMTDFIYGALGSIVGLITASFAKKK